ncbi:probable tRNA methyltransferase 9B [Spea bombifrons]|uniref:probable tRNA methyltransferase 9B n=1 Tax=Spea bombifrons TaxID=233779 RepID=UPI00234B4C8D|nr:probable tRNA methyltransferase 9B [Spea bombifrons]XP_053313757.1 probable tRNA methyltransferase 9B [Spea bombifrons]
MDEEASRLEKLHVHSVYEKIAPYFNDKRYKAWPKVQKFILAQEPGSLIADIGCANGKYLHINSQTFKMGCDYCVPLAESARNKGYEIMVCDGLNLPYRSGCFDAVLSIAVIHHFSTKERRIQAIRELSRILRVGGQVMICVWAKEQKRRKFEKQDILVPWHLELSSSNISSENLQQSVTSDSGNVRLHQRTNRTLEIHNLSKQCSADEGGEMSGKSFHNLVRSNVLSRSLDSGLDLNFKCEGSNQKYQGILSRFYDYCSQISIAKHGHPFELSKPSGFLRQLSDVFPKYVQNFHRTDIRRTEATTLPFHSVSGPSAAQHLHGTDLIEDYSNVPLPDLQSHTKSLKPSTTKSCAEPVYKSINEHEANAASDGEIAAAHLNSETKNNNCLRYYHIFKKGELKELIEKCIPELHVVQTFFDHSNWCVIAEKVQIWKI